MAEKQAGGVSVRIGLTLNQLQSDFLAAEQTVKQGIAALNRQQNIVKLRMETDTAGLDALTDKNKILEIQERAITQLLEMQRDKLTLATKAYQDYASSKDANEVVAKKLETSMERERLAVARLEAQLKSLSAQQVLINTTKLQDSIAQLNSKIQHVKIQAELDVSKLQGANAAFDAQKIHIAAVTKEIELQRQKLVQLQETMYRSAKLNGGDSAQTLTFKTNVLQQIQEIQKLENKLKELQNTKVDLQIRADNFRQVESQIHEKISLLNAKLEHIKVKTDIDLSRLNPMASEFDKAKAHVHNLNQELTLQNQKLVEMKKLLATSISANGLGNVKTINLQTEIQKQIQAIDKLKAKINELNKIQPPKNNNLLSGYLNIKGDVVGKLNEISTAFNNLKGATASADSAITSSLSVIGSIPHPVGRAVAAFAAMPVVLKGVENSLVDMSKAAASAGDSVYVMSRGFQMSVADTGKFTAMCKTAGVEVNDLASTIKRTQQQIIRGGDTSKAEQWLKRYGESAFDASGHLKDLNAMTLTLSRALKKAQAEGNGMAFILATMRNASADAITAIEDAEDVYKQAAGLVKNGLLDPKFAHEVQGNINAMNLQAGYMNAAFSSALLPVANEIVPLLTERMGKLTQVIADNKEIIKDFGLTAAEVFKFIEGLAEGAATVVGSVVKSMHEFTTEKKKSTVEIFLDDEDVKDVESLMKKDLLRQGLDRELKMVEANRDLYQRTYAYYEPMLKAIEDRRKELERKNEELKKELEKQLTSVADLSSVAADRLKVEKNPDLLKGAESLKKILQEASDIQYKLSHTDYENKKLDLLQQQQDMLNQAEMTAEKREAIEKLGSAKLAQIEQEHADKLKEIRDSVEAADKTALQNKLDNIEKERQAWIQAGMEKAEAEALAQKELSDYVKNVQKDLTNAVTKLYQTSLEQRLNQIEKEKQAWIDKCNDEVKATQWAEQAKADAQRNAAMATLRQKAEEYDVYQKGGYAGLRAYKAEQLAAQGVNPKYLYITPEQLADFQKANQVAEKSMLPNLMTKYDRAEHAQQMQNWRDFSSQINAEHDKQNYAIVDGIKKGMSEILPDIKFEYGKNDFDERHTMRLSPDGDRYTRRDDRYSYDEDGRLSRQETHIKNGELPTIQVPENYQEILQSVQGVSDSFSEIAPNVQSAAETFGELPVAVQGVTESLSGLEMPQLEGVENIFSSMEPEIQNLAQQFSAINVSGENFAQQISSMCMGVDEVTVKLSDLSAAIQNFSLPNENSATEKVPVEVNTTVQIDEAHAWDYDHIQELAEKVADILEPRIISAIGGDSNSY